MSGEDDVAAQHIGGVAAGRVASGEAEASVGAAEDALPGRGGGDAAGARQDEVEGAEVVEAAAVERVDERGRGDAGWTDAGRRADVGVGIGGPGLVGSDGEVGRSKAEGGSSRPLVGEMDAGVGRAEANCPVVGTIGVLRCCTSLDAAVQKAFALGA